jgi:hypothetical protein
MKPFDFSHARQIKMIICQEGLGNTVHTNKHAQTTVVLDVNAQHKIASICHAFVTLSMQGLYVHCQNQASP